MMSTQPERAKNRWVKVVMNGATIIRLYTACMSTSATPWTSRIQTGSRRFYRVQYLLHLEGLGDEWDTQSLAQLGHPAHACV